MVVPHQCHTESSFHSKMFAGIIYRYNGYYDYALFTLNRLVCREPSISPLQNIRGGERHFIVNREEGVSPHSTPRIRKTMGRDDKPVYPIRSTEQTFSMEIPVNKPSQMGTFAITRQSRVHRVSLAPYFLLLVRRDI